MPKRTARYRPRARSSHREGALVELTIEALGARGDGLASHDGTRVFVPLTLPAERVRARLGEWRADGIAAQLIDILTPSEARRQPPCPHFGSCGGCQLQHMATEAEASWKSDEIARALARRGIVDFVMRPIVTVRPATRRRTRLVARSVGDGTQLGYHARASHSIVDVESCAVLEPRLDRLLPALRDLAAALLPAAAECALVLTAADSGIDLTVEATAPADMQRREALARFVADHDLARAGWCVRGRIDPIAERRPAYVVFDGLRVPLPPLAFLQASREGEAAIAAAVVEAVGDAASVVDLFAGLGTLTFPLARHMRVHAVDGDADAIAALAAAARQSAHAGRITWSERDLAAEPLSADELARFDAAVFDPPRAGAKAQSEAVGESVIKNAVSVSCNPSTFARDARILVDRGFALDWVQPIDQFVWSSRIELVARFVRTTS